MIDSPKYGIISLMIWNLTAMDQDKCEFRATPFLPGQPLIYVELYVDDFVYFSESDKVEEWFC